MSFGQKKLVRLAGTYSYSLGGDKASGTILVYPESDSTLLFYIDLNRGASTYNMGSLFGRVRIAHDIGIFENKNKSCRWTMKFSNNILTVVTIDKYYNCGFGHGVTADGAYDQKSTAIPETFETAEGIKFSFNTTTPEIFNK